MRVFIPSKSRFEPGQQRTINALPDKILEKTTLVVPEKEAHHYDKFGVNVVCPPRSVKGIGPTRQWIVSGVFDKILMLDDDLHFITRRHDDPTKFKEATPSEIIRAFKEAENMLDKYAHIGFCAREGGNRNTEKYTENTRLLRALGYNTKILREHKVRFNRVPVMEDFDVALQLLRLGFRSLLINWFGQGQWNSNAPGGCSTYRTPELQAEGANKLKELHPEFVRVVEKETKTAWGWGKRTDVTVYWKKAYESSFKC
jgi:hypothetical protein